MGLSGEIGMLGGVQLAGPIVCCGDLPVILTGISIYVVELIDITTSTFQPLSRIDSNSSRGVFTLLESTAVHVGRIVPSLLSTATSLCVSNKPPYL